MKSWQGYCLVEPSVHSVLADFIRPGQTAFEVGSFTGGLAVVMSRLVGPTGKVVAFEANPQTANLAADQFIANGASNIFLVNRAIEAVSGKRVKFFMTNGVGDSLFESSGQPSRSVEVQTLCLDDFVTAYGVEPDFLKFDIEGAEFLALRGFEKYIERKKPSMILEQSSNDFKCIDLLRSKGYIAVDLHNYRALSSVTDYPDDGMKVRNVICLHAGLLKRRPDLSPYLDPKVHTLCRFGAEQSSRSHNVLAFPDIVLQPGRYILESQIVAGNPNASVFSGILDSANAFVARYHAPAGVLARERIEMPFHLEEAMSVRPALVADGNHDISAAIEDVSISLSRVDGFGARPLARMVLGS